MTDFVERLPVRLAALAGIIVGVVGSIAGEDAWEIVKRIGIAFLVFGILGLALRALLQHGSTPPKPPPPPPEDGTETGTNVDQKTPEMTIDDL